jgi:hypothetical protein
MPTDTNPPGTISMDSGQYYEMMRQTAMLNELARAENIRRNTPPPPPTLWDMLRENS